MQSKPAPESHPPAFRHSHASKHLCIPGEDPGKLDALRAELRAEHQPATVTEELLVDEIAQHFWNMKRYRSFQSSMFAPVRVLSRARLLSAPNVSSG